MDASQQPQLKQVCQAIKSLPDRYESQEPNGSQALSAKIPAKTFQSAVTFDDLLAEIRSIFQEDRVDIDYLKKLLTSYKSNPQDWKKFAHYDRFRYTRNLVEDHEKYNIMILNWVIDGTLKETQFAWPEKINKDEDEVEEMKLTSENNLSTNEVTYINDQVGLHRVENPSHMETAASLHIYIPPYRTCNTFDQRTGHAREVKVTFYSKNGNVYTMSVDDSAHSASSLATPAKKSKLRVFNHKPFKRRHIALKLLYLGWDYDGLASQIHSQNTIEHHLFEALIKTCMIKSRQEANFQRCGRTDKGVSSYGQVVSLDVRSLLTDEQNTLGLFTPEDYEPRQSQRPGEMNVANSEIKDINYVGILNRVLPKDIRAIAWAPCKREFSSRFDCKSRSYYYIFPRGNLCITSMSRAVEYLIGHHDFRNLCTFDLKGGVVSHLRTVYSAKIESDITNLQESAMCRMIITGQGFLYHQIRCIMSIVLLVGMKLEEPEIMRDLLDIERVPAKPHYTMASPLPLILFDCSYDDTHFPEGWIYDGGAADELISSMKKLWCDYSLKANIVDFMLRDLRQKLSPCLDESARSRLANWSSFGLRGDMFTYGKYVPIKLRSQSESLESRLERKRNQNQSNINIKNPGSEPNAQQHANEWNEEEQVYENS
ncbi:tRNA pseudouridine(38/39) synthase, partial [Fragariocoptes setiger]